MRTKKVFGLAGCVILAALALAVAAAALSCEGGGDELPSAAAQAASAARAASTVVESAASPAMVQVALETLKSAGVVVPDGFISSASLRFEAVKVEVKTYLDTIASAASQAALEETVAALNLYLTDLCNLSPTPSADEGSVALDNVEDASVSFTLDSSVTGEWKVYETPGLEAESARVAVESFDTTTRVLTLSSIDGTTPIPVGIYYVTVTVKGKGESRALELEVLPPGTFTIRFVLNGGVSQGLALPDRYTADDLPLTLETLKPTRAYHEFLGWYDNADLSGEAAASIPAGSTGNKTFWAAWSDVPEYTITYHLGDYTVPSTLTVTYTIDETTPQYTLLVPERPGHTFLGWYSDSGLSGTATYSLIKGNQRDEEFWAKWSDAETYTITYYLNGGTGPETAVYTVEEPVTLPVPTQGGKTFLGWYTDSGFGGEEVTTLPQGSEGDREFWAKWSEAVAYPITYRNLFDESGAEAIETAFYTAEADRALPQDKTRAGYEFTGWYTAADGGDEVALIAKGSTGARTFWARWEAITYKITYSANGGEGELTPATYGVENGAITPLDIRKAGYDFGGWYTDSGFSGTAVTTIPAGSTGDRAFYAKWDVLTYTVTYNLDGGTGAADTTYTVEDKTITLPIPTKAANTFLGWYTGADLSWDYRPVSTIPAGSTGYKEFYAKWSPEAANSITYDLDGGAGPASGKYTTNEVFYPPLPSKTGYTFEGWYTAKTGGDAVTSIDAGTTVSKLYARWTVNTYDLTYETAGGSLTGGQAAGSVAYGDSVRLPSSGTRTGYTLANFTLSGALSGTKLKGATITMPAGDVTVTANWTAAPYKVTFDANGGGTPSPASVTVTYDAKYGALASVSRAGFSFEGWYTAKDGGEKVTASTTVTITAAQTLYAHWKAVLYTVALDGNGGNSPQPPLEVSYGAAYGPLPVTNRTGYAFEGWYTSSTGGTKVTSATVVTSAANHTLYAKWWRLTSVSLLSSYLRALETTSETEPAVAPLVDLNISESWGAINAAVKSGAKYVTLDLSACTLAAAKTLSGQQSPSGNALNVMRDNVYIKGLVLPDELLIIGDWAFYGCSSLTSVSIPAKAKVTGIGKWAFAGCYGLTEMDIPNSVTSIGLLAFSGCTSLATVTIGEDVKTIGDSAFDQCASLTSVTLPAGVTIGNSAFPQGESGAGGGALKTAYESGAAGTYTRDPGGDEWRKTE